MSGNTLKSALIIVDNQAAFRDVQYWGVARSNPDYESNLVLVLDAFGQLTPKALIVHVQHHSLSPNSLLSPKHPSSKIELATYPLAGESVITKHVNSAFIGTNLEEIIRNHEIEKLYIMGITTDHCVSTTTRMAANLGVTRTLGKDGTGSAGEVVLIGDATACFQKYEGSWSAETVHAVNVESLREFATIASTDEVIRQISSTSI